MVEINLSLLAPEEMPITDEKKEKPQINLVQENLNYLIAKKNLTPSQIQKETSIPWSTFQGWCDFSVKAQLVDLNMKELVDYLEVDFYDFAFVNLRERDNLNQVTISN